VRYSRSEKSGIHDSCICLWTWEIYKFEEVAGHGREKRELAQKEIGRKITFGRKAVSYDKDFLFFDPQCSRVSYTFEVR
jgi:hypothetical protein